MSVAQNFRKEWWEMVNVEEQRNRAALLKREQKEVMHEMIFQDWKEGKTHQKLADMYNVNKSTVWRITNRKRK